MIAKFIFPLGIILILYASHTNSFVHKMSAGIALICGILLSFIFKNPYANFMKKMTSKLLMWSVIGLGFGMNLITVAQVGFHGIGYTILSILFCTAIGLLLGKFFKTERDTSVLITFGTAICGGSAIAAIAPAIKAKHHDVIIALAIVFFLNAISLFIFPFIGHFLQLSQSQFGLWSALAIHDTSSVVGANLQYGAKALEIGTTVKLARALWIVPVTLIISFIYSRYYFHTDPSTSKIKKPWFILGFLCASALVTWIPIFKIPGLYLRNIAEQTLIVTLYFIGTSLSREAIKVVGLKPFLQGLSLWIIIATSSLLFVLK